jgi:beta-N-acetylhexosaminidase
MLVHFVFMPDSAGNAVSESEIPTVSDEPTLAPTPTHATEAPTEAPTEPDYAAMADTYMAKMSDYEKLCQLFIVTPEVLTSALDDSDSDAAVTVAGSMTEKSLEKYPVGGIIYFADNLEDIDQTEEMIANSQKYASTPLFIAVDEEGGDVARVADKLGTKAFKPMLEYKDEGTEVAHDNAEVISSNLRVVGFNMDNAPVADVLSNPDNTVIGSRAYSDDYAQAAELVAAAVEGFHDGGVVTVLKHFPGHGGTDEDSHDGLAYVDTSVEDLKKNELLPFKAGIEAGTDMVMVGHLVVTDLDPDMPASLSSKVVPELLRKELGYDGIVITDSMSMAAITYDYDTTVRGLFAADVDVILQPDNLDRYIESIQNLLDSGEITQAQIDAKVKKILTLKYRQGIMKAVQPDPVGETIAPADNATEAPADNAANAVEQPTDAALPEEQPTAA